ncbi:SRPBCC family protein [Pseudonocardia sp. MH-G8]|uniref:SRPBCC family protein n=1 Tax=Pseudonocardia sp. MH-G8 TaxID=1854588 RepID=UPI000BA0E13B|nr:SRPBCC family protein [Pseudonocardia sp. MH-G8]OZM80123.1 activator of HSP90 ATPase [Pseudonocardia sp. MH-G8]
MPAPVTPEPISGPTGSIEESLLVPLPPQDVYAAISDVRRMREWSPEVVAVWRFGQRFVGVNRSGPFLWFTTCRIVVAVPGREFAFDVTTFGLPVARWGYRLTTADGATLLTEYWADHRGGGWRGRVVEVLGRAFTGTPPEQRAARNRQGMRTTLQRFRDASVRAAP